jgi:hypothetical protein
MSRAPIAADDAAGFGWPQDGQVASVYETLLLHRGHEKSGTRTPRTVV